MQFVPAPDPLLAPTWVTAAFTIVLAVGAIVTAVFAVRAFRAQSSELAALRKDRRRDALDRHRSRAALVYVTAGFSSEVRTDADPPGFIRLPRDARVSASVHNTGLQPVYDVRVHWVDAAKGSQAGDADIIGTLPPGGDRQVERVVPDSTVQDQLVPVVFFRDATGLRWTLLADGRLEEYTGPLPAGAPLIATTAADRASGGRPGDAGA